jgi:hypothetical protein
MERVAQIERSDQARHQPASQAPSWPAGKSWRRPAGARRLAELKYSNHDNVALPDDSRGWWLAARRQHAGGRAPDGRGRAPRQRASALATSAARCYYRRGRPPVGDADVSSGPAVVHPAPARRASATHERIHRPFGPSCQARMLRQGDDTSQASCWCWPVSSLAGTQCGFRGRSACDWPAGGLAGRQACNKNDRLAGCGRVQTNRRRPPPMSPKRKRPELNTAISALARPAKADASGTS